jgi:hypothetical protein
MFPKETIESKHRKDSKKWDSILARAPQLAVWLAGAWWLNG